MSIIFTPDTVTLSHMVNRLAAIKASIANLKQEEEEIKAGLISLDLPIVESDLYRVSVAQCNGRVVVDWKAVAEKLNPSRQLVTAHTTQGEPFYAVRVSSRKS
jgi:hypothetical protein